MNKKPSQRINISRNLGIYRNETKHFGRQKDIVRMNWKKMEVHRSTISKVETGKFAITVDYLIRFARYLDFDLEISETPEGYKKL
jgi:hypothetical protein